MKLGKKVKRLSGRTTSSVSGEKDYQVTGEEPGSKFENAEQEGVKILNEEEFKNFLNEQI